MTLWLDTLRGLAAPRRAIAILAVTTPLLAAQHVYSVHWSADALALGMVTVFLLLGPWSYRALFGPTRASRSWPLLRAAAFLALAGVPGWIAVGVPSWFELPSSFLTVGVNLAVSTMLFVVGSWGLARDIELEQGWHTERARATAMEREAERATLLAMRAHLDPHFLFNTLNAIAEWAREDGEIAEKAILRLSGLLREVMQGVKAPSWSLDHELGVARDVWELHRIRDPDRYRYRWDVEAADVRVPPLLLLPVVENAVKHGPASGHEGELALSARVEGGRLRIEVSNPGPWAGPRPGGEGMEMVRKRLALAYAGDAALEVHSADNRTTVALDLPATGPTEVT